MIFVRQVRNEDKLRSGDCEDNGRGAGGFLAYLLGEILRNQEPSFYYFVENFYRHQLVLDFLKKKTVGVKIEMVS